MTPTKQKIKPPSHSQKHICLAFESEAKYNEIVADTEKFRDYLDQAWREHPEIFPGRSVEASGFMINTGRASKQVSRCAGLN